MQHTNDFALYTEAIKFFNHSESMVRIAVRTITLNVYRGEKLLTLDVIGCILQFVQLHMSFGLTNGLSLFYVWLLCSTFSSISGF